MNPVPIISMIFKIVLKLLNFPDKTWGLTLNSKEMLSKEVLKISAIR